MSSSFPPPPEARGAKSKPVWKRWWLWAAAIVVILIAAGVSSSDTNDTATESVSPTPETTTSAASSTVSDVVGADVDTASTELEAQGFDVRVKTKVTDDAAEDTVLSQSPAAGSSVESGHTIVLVVAESLPLVPNVVGDKVAKARSELKDAGFGVDVKQQESSKPKGTVIAQSPKGGTSAAAPLRHASRREGAGEALLRPELLRLPEPERRGL